MNNLPPILIPLGLFSPSLVFYLLGAFDAAVIVFLGGFISYVLIAYAPEIQDNQTIMRFLRKYF